MKKPRKAKPIHLNAVERAIELSQRLPRRDQLSLKFFAMNSLENLRKGKGGEPDIRNLIDALNVGEELAVIGICSDANSRTMIQNGQDAQIRLYERQKERASWTMKSDEMSAMNEALFIHGVQLEYCSMSEFLRAQKTVKEKARQALAGNHSEFTKVLA